MSYGIDKETDEVKFEAIADILDTFEVEEGVASTSQRPQRTRVLPERLQDYEVVGNDEVTPDVYSLHFTLLAGAEPINYSEVFKDKRGR